MMKMPENLSESSQKWIRRLAKKYDFGPGETDLLFRAGELRDRAEQARQQVETDGPYYSNRFGEPRQHPAIRVEQQSIDLMARILKQLRIDAEKGGRDADD